MTTKSTSLLEPTLGDAFDIGHREGLKEALTEIKTMVEVNPNLSSIKAYVDARLKSIHDFSLNNPFKQKD